MLKFSGWVRTSVLPKSDRRYLRNPYVGSLRRYLQHTKVPSTYEGTFVGSYLGTIFWRGRTDGITRARTTIRLKMQTCFLHGGLDPPTLALHRRVNLPTAIFRKYKRIFDI